VGREEVEELPDSGFGSACSSIGDMTPLERGDRGGTLGTVILGKEGRRKRGRERDGSSFSGFSRVLKSSSTQAGGEVK